MKKKPQKKAKKKKPNPNNFESCHYNKHKYPFGRFNCKIQTTGYH